MARWVCMAACAVSACFSPKPPAGAPCDPLAPVCPAGQSCVYVGGAYVCSTVGGGQPDDAYIPDDGTLPDDGALPDVANVPDAGNNDLDGDGVANAIDNCPTVGNASQYNEDGDSFGDACDKCPPVADNAQPDADADGVSDACDPRPTMGGDAIALFEGFGAGVPPAWFKTGTWTAASGSISINTIGGRGSITVAGPTTTHDTVSASFTVVAISSTQDAGIGVFDTYDHLAVPTKGLYCHLTN